MIATSYFGNWRKFPEGMRQVSIAVWSPKGFKGEKYPALAPSKELVQGFKDGKLSEGGYTGKYIQQLEKLTPEHVASELQGCILLCYEKSGDFCHRHIVREWLDSCCLIKEL